MARAKDFLQITRYNHHAKLYITKININLFFIISRIISGKKKDRKKRESGIRRIFQDHSS